MESVTLSLPRGALIAGGFACIALGAAGGWLGSRLAIDSAVHDYLIAHPEVLPEAMEHLQARETHEALAGVRGQVETAFPGAVLGNPHGKVTLVEFTDYACGFCRRSVGDVEALTRANPELKVVVRELPILSPDSADAAKMALAAAAQGRFAAFHKALFELGRPDPASVADAARTAGLDMARARMALDDPRLASEISQNLDLARQINISGTPAWVVGDRMVSGAVGLPELSRMVAAAKG